VRFLALLILKKALAQLVNREAQRLGINYSDDIFPMFDHAFSRLGTPDGYFLEAFNKVYKRLSEP
jgi:hypothetical protein